MFVRYVPADAVAIVIVLSLLLYDYWHWHYSVVILNRVAVQGVYYVEQEQWVALDVRYLFVETMDRH